MEVRRVPPDQSSISFPDPFSAPDGMDESETSLTLPLNSGIGTRKCSCLFHLNYLTVEKWLFDLPKFGRDRKLFQSQNI